MKLPKSLFSLLGIALLLPATAGAAPLFHYKATALFPVQTEEYDPKNPGGTIIKKLSLGTKEIINLGLGKPLSTKNGPDIVLAVALNHDNPGTARLVVYNKKTLTELTTVLVLVTAPATNVSSKDGDKGTGNGLAPGRIQATTLGTPSQDGLDQTDICGAATGGLTPTETGPTFKMSATGIIGDIKGRIAGQILDGLIIKGMFTASGKPIDHF
jgi:hypothetical protein